MVPSFLKKHRKFFCTLSFGGIALSLAACNSGGAGSSGDLESQTAPRTLEGVELTLYEGGPVLGFRRTSGSFDTEIGSENGLVFMVDGPGILDLTDNSFGDGELPPFDPNTVTSVNIDGVDTPLVITPAVDLGNVTYTYNRIEPRVGEIFIQGNSGPTLLPQAALGQLPFFHTAPRPDSDSSFEHRFRVEFGSTGLVVDNVTVRLQLDREAYVVQLRDTSVNPAIQQANSSEGLGSVLNFDSSIQLLNGNGPLFVGYDPTDSEFLDLNPIFPVALDGASMRFTPAVGDIINSSNGLIVRFLQSSFTPELESSSFEETGTIFNAELSSPEFNDPIGSYIYSTVAAQGSDFRAGLTITLTNRPDIAANVDTEFTLQFVTQTGGDYTNDRGGSGTFSLNRFLVLDQFGGGLN